MGLIKSPKEFWAALLYLGFGCAALYLGSEYRVGSAGRMGPGYFPRALAWMLIAVGVFCLGRAMIQRGEPMGGVAWKPLLLVLLACALFGALLPRAGLLVALVVLCLVSASASRKFRFDPKASAGLIVLVVFCAALFAKGLGVPMPLWGTWFETYVASLPVWMR